MVFHKENWIEFEGRFYAKKASKMGLHLVGEFKDHKLTIVGNMPFETLPKQIKTKVEKEYKE
jgi:hypothetical protein